MVEPDTAGDTHRGGTLRDVVLHGPVGTGFLIGVHFQHIVNANHRDSQYALDVLNVAFDIGPETVGMGSYFLGRQHAGEGAHHSGRDRTDDVIQGGGMLLDRVDLVKFLYPAVDTIIDRLRKAFYLSDPDRTPVPRDRDFRGVNNCGHGQLSFLPVFDIS